MIVSHKYKFIFIKPQKCAGTSVELLLSRICGPKDIITPLGFDPDPHVREKSKATKPRNYWRPKSYKSWAVRDLYYLFRHGIWPHSSYWEHLSAQEIKKYVGQKTWDDYLKISIVRNPWDHAVSWYRWQAKYGFEGTQDGEFDRYLRNNYRSTWPFYTINGLFDMDHIIRFEQLELDVESLSKDLTEIKNYRLPETKVNPERSRDYKTFYENDKQIELVRRKSLSVIDHFDYRF